MIKSFKLKIIIILLCTLFLGNIMHYPGYASELNSTVEPASTLEPSTTIAPPPTIVKPPEIIELVSPTGVTVVSVGDGQVSLKWDAISEPILKEYQIDYMGADGIWVTKISKSNSYTINGLTNDVVYSFKVRAININNNSSADSSLVTATPTPGSETASNNNKEHYVSVSGNDEYSGTIEQPWRTIKKAVSMVKPGDTVYIRQGTYAERVVLRTSGTSGNFITYTAFPGESVIIDGSAIDWGADWGSLFDTNKCNNIKLSGLKVINSRWAGIGNFPTSNGSNNVIIENCSTYNTKSSGIWFAFGNNITIKGNIVEQACNGGNQECITLNDINNFEISNNHVFNSPSSSNGGEGIDVKCGCSNGKVFNNEVNNTNSVGIYIDAFNQHQYNIEVFGNRVHDCYKGIVVATESGGLLENVCIHNNVLYNNNFGFGTGDWGKSTSHPMNNISFVNNTSYHCVNAGIQLCNTDAKKVVIANNIFDNGAAPYSRPIEVIRANLNETTIDSNFLDKIDKNHPTGTRYIIGDPEFVNPVSDFHLQASSKAINAAQPYGYGNNMGAF